MSKTLVLGLEILLNAPIIAIASFLLGWIQPYETLELILVIIIIPVIMNGFAFWFQDNFLMKKETSTPVEGSRETRVESANEARDRAEPPISEKSDKG